MFDKIKKNYFILIITFLYIYFFFNLLGGDRGLISYLKKKDIYKELKIKKTDLTVVTDCLCSRTTSYDAVDPIWIQAGSMEDRRMIRAAENQPDNYNVKLFPHQLTAIYYMEEKEKNKVEYRPIVTGNFVKNDVLKYFDYSIHKKLKNADHLHDNGFFVDISELNVEGLVHVSTLNNDWYEYRSRQNLLIGRKSKKSYKVGDEIEVKIVKVDILKYQIDLELT